MKRSLFTIISLCLFFGAIYSNYKRQTPKSDLDYDSLGQIPVVLNGRIQPLDSVARNTLLAINGKSTATYQDGSRHKAIEWLAEVLFQPQLALDRPVFRIHDEGIRSLLPHKEPKQSESMVKRMLLGSGSSQNYYSLNEIRTAYEKIRQDAVEASDIDTKVRTR